MAINTHVPSASPAPDEPLRMTFEEFHEWLDEDTWAEWVNGEVIRLSPASKNHQDIVRFLLNLFSHFIEHHDLGWIACAPFLMKPGETYPGREPDILFVKNEHMDRVKPTFIDGPADLVVEIVSLESRSRDRGDKFYEYEQAGVQEYWLLDPLRKLADFYVRDENGHFLVQPLDHEGKYHSRVLSGLWIQADWLWRSPLPPLVRVLKEWKLI